VDVGLAGRSEGWDVGLGWAVAAAEVAALAFRVVASLSRLSLGVEEST
jgi:hypothetical protein